MCQTTLQEHTSRARLTPKLIQNTGEVASFFVAWAEPEMVGNSAQVLPRLATVYYDYCGLLPLLVLLLPQAYQMAYLQPGPKPTYTHYAHLPTGPYPYSVQLLGLPTPGLAVGLPLLYTPGATAHDRKMQNRSQSQKTSKSRKTRKVSKFVKSAEKLKDSTTSRKN